MSVILTCTLVVMSYWMTSLSFIYYNYDDNGDYIDARDDEGNHLLQQHNRVI